jgi:hypothetical protein
MCARTAGGSGRSTPSTTSATHGRLIKVESIYGAEPERATVLLFDADSAELIETNTLGQADYVITTGPLRYIDGEQHYPTKGTVIITLKQGRP